MRFSMNPIPTISTLNLMLPTICRGVEIQRQLFASTVIESSSCTLKTYVGRWDLKDTNLLRLVKAVSISPQCLPRCTRSISEAGASWSLIRCPRVKVCRQKKLTPRAFTIFATSSEYKHELPLPSFRYQRRDRRGFRSRMFGGRKRLWSAMDRTAQHVEQECH